MSTQSVSSSTTGPHAGEASPDSRTRHHQIVIVGGGTGGATAAAQLCRRLKDPDVAVIEPSETHDYQPLWTLVGGVVPKEQSRHKEADVLPSRATWIKDRVTRFDPANNQVILQDGGRVSYDYLIVAVGIKLNWEAVKGLTAEQIGRDGICSNYLYEGCEGTWRTLREFKGGTALFTMPPPPIKCAGAPQKIMYLADDYFRKTGVRDRSRVIYASGTPGIFSVKEFAKTLNEVIARKGIETCSSRSWWRSDRPITSRCSRAPRARIGPRSSTP